MKSNKIKITCTAEQKKELIYIMANSDSCFNDEMCADGESCEKCVEKDIDWEIVEPVKDFKELTIAEFENHCSMQKHCDDCVYLEDCAHAFTGRGIKQPYDTWISK